MGHDSLHRLNTVLMLLGLAAKAALFVALFLWAGTSAAGDAALRGVVFGDLFTWIIFSALDFHLGRRHITIGAIFELALLVVFTNRESLLSIPVASVTMAMTMGAFFGFVLLKTAVWGAQRAVHSTGLKEIA